MVSRALLVRGIGTVFVVAISADAGEVEPGTERVAVASQRDRPNVVVGGCVTHGGDDRLDQLAVDRVLPIGPVQAQHPQVSVGLNVQHLRHGRER